MLSMNFEIPIGYQWLLDRKLVGSEPFSQLQPWYFLLQDKCFWVSEIWNKKIDKNLFAYARRQDCDTIACFSVSEFGKVLGVVLIQGWTNDGFDICEEFPTFWDWLKMVVDDISIWVESEN